MKAVEDGLRRLDGVDQIEIDLQTNVVTITPDSAREYDLRAFPRAIRDSGFKPGEMRIRARGDIDAQGRLRIHGWSAPLQLTKPAATAQDLQFRGRVNYEGESVVLVPVEEP